MQEMTLVVLAAGMGSRFGGLKQMEKIDEGGHVLIDYSVYDAIRVGFCRVVFIIRKEIEKEFLSLIKTRRWYGEVDVDLVFQENGMWGVKRKKPWGTAHAISCLSGVVTTPFAVINSDDFYGRGALRKVYGFLSDNHEKGNYALVAYRLRNTLSKNGGVSRGVCQSAGEFLSKITETVGLHECEGKIFSSESMVFSPETSVSMNLWGFTPDIIDECNNRFYRFLNERMKKTLGESEFYLPDVVSELIEEGRAKVKLLQTDEKWYGITYREDCDEVREALQKSTLYPRIL